MRESAMYDRILMDGMISQTLAKVSGLPGAAELAEVGVKIFDEPGRYGGIARRSGDSRMVLVERDGVLYHYSMGTAAKNDLPDTNGFVKELVDMVDTYRPKEVWVAAFTRLLRAAEFGGELMQSLTKSIETLHCETDLDLTTPEGKLVFQVLTMIASAERDYIVRRHTAGRVAKWRRGEWLATGHPPGYQLVDKTLLLDHGSVVNTRKMLAVLADQSLTAAQCAAELGSLGITTPALTRLYGDDATVSDARNPSEIINTLVGWADSYESGIYEMLWPNPFPGVRDIAGLAVEEADPADYPNGVLRLVQQLPLPDGDWADAATFDAIRRRSTGSAVTGGASHKATPPLAGMFKFAADGMEHAVIASKGIYRLVRRPQRPDRRFAGWTAEAERPAEGSDIEHLGTVKRTDWHRSIAERVIEAVRDGLPAELDATRFQPEGGLPPLDARRAKARVLRRELADTKAALTRARRNVGLTDDDELATEFMAQVEQHRRDEKRLEAELSALDDVDETPTLTRTFDSNAELVARAIAALADAPGAADGALGAALRAVISRERWRVDGPTVHWELTIELPHEEGTVVLGPIKGQVANVLRRPHRSPQAPRARNDARTELVAAGLPEHAARSAAACTHLELRGALLADLRGDPVPAGVDPEWRDHIVKVYTDPAFTWATGKWRLEDTVRRRTLEALRSAGGTLSGRALKDHDLTERQLRYLSDCTDAPSGNPIITRHGRASGRVYELLRCPHCGHHADHSIVTPETVPGVLCSNCWRTPRPDSPVFPDWYRTPLE